MNADHMATIADNLAQSDPGSGYKRRAEEIRATPAPVYRVTIGIDPGVNGALVAITDKREVLHCIDLPTLKEGKTTRINGVELARQLRFIRRMHPGAAELVVIEHAQAMPKQGASSQFNFGCTWGIIRGVVMALGLPWLIVQPRAWKKHHGLIGKDKAHSITSALSQIPTACQYLTRKKDADRAEAMLLALYGERQEHEVAA